ncbi:membrane protein insertion efficiency factor YidD [Streptomyces yerevanensis]|uniref:membrane protein insertion efficiency factor YidD n=1 Tax=Streptomyces yerevanensis TaxID=66378 RepID=UPI003CCC07F4
MEHLVRSAQSRHNSTRPYIHQQRKNVMSNTRRKKDSGRQRKATTQDSWWEVLLDACICCRGVCPAAWLIALGTVLTRPAARLQTGARDDPAAPRPPGWLATKMYAVVHYYRVSISPTQPARCPYKPSCSTYAVQALYRHGAFRGGWLIMTRLLRCRPAAARRRGFRDTVPS